MPKSKSTCLSRLRPELAKYKLDALFVTNETSVQYLSGFTGDDTFLLITDNKAFLITDSRYTEQAQNETKRPGVSNSASSLPSRPAERFRVIEHTNGLVDKTIELIKKHRIKRLGFEADSLSYALAKDLSKRLPRYTKLKPTQGIIVTMAATKTPEEIKGIRESIKCALEAFKEVKGSLKPGVSEQAIAAELEYRMRKKGATRPAFPSIVAADNRASLPHARATNKTLKKNSLVQFDWGACVNQYNSDTSRVVFLGKPSKFWQKIYAIVLEAQQRAINKIRPGVDTTEVDKAARGFIESKGYGPNFGHGLGHGVGRLIHELPSIKRYSLPKAMKPKPYFLQPGMVFTVEPGIYIPGKGGIRIEDMVLVTQHGCEILTSSLPKTIEEMVV